MYLGGKLFTNCFTHVSDVSSRNIAICTTHNDTCLTVITEHLVNDNILPFMTQIIINLLFYPEYAKLPRMSLTFPYMTPITFAKGNARTVVAVDKTSYTTNRKLIDFGQTVERDKDYSLQQFHDLDSLQQSPWKPNSASTRGATTPQDDIRIRRYRDDFAKKFIAYRSRFKPYNFTDRANRRRRSSRLNSAKFAKLRSKFPHLDIYKVLLEGGEHSLHEVLACSVGAATCDVAIVICAMSA